MPMIDTALTSARPDRTLASRADWYGAVWRWHFYAGLFCVPFVIWLSVTGSIYLWRQQIETWLDRPYAHLSDASPAADPDAQVAAAVRAVPGSRVHRYIVPDGPDQAVRILVEKAGEDWRVMLHPRTLDVLDVAKEEQRPMRLLFHLHGELLAGAVGSYLVETAACWAVVMLLTGLYLWWPRGNARLAGVAYPRLRAGSRILWRDLHATAGLWVSVFALALILTGLPWAQGWGTYLAGIRTLTGTTRGAVDWTIGGKPPRQGPMIGDDPAHTSMAMPGHATGAGATGVVAPGDLARVIAAVRPLAIAPPVTVTPPRQSEAPWQVASDAADRPLRSDATVDGHTGAVTGEVLFAQRHWIDRAIGYGVAAHEGALFGLANQILGTATALLLVVLAMSGVVMWWRRRPSGRLGAPAARGRVMYGGALVGAILLLGVTMPMFGLTLVLVLSIESLVLRRIAGMRDWLGLPRPMS